METVSERIGDDNEVVVVGAGLAGLAAAVALHKAGRRVTIVEASDGVGGRVRSDVVDGFILDRGFQVLLSAYPEVKNQIDLDALDFRAFTPGAVIRVKTKFFAFADPLRKPSLALASARAPIGTVRDKVRLALMLQELKTGTVRTFFRREDISTFTMLKKRGFSQKIIDSFFTPLLGGIQLDASLHASRRMAEAIVHCLGKGESGVPAKGMQTLSDQMAAKLPHEAIICNEKVVAVAHNAITTEKGETITAKRVIVATDGPAAASLLTLADPGSKPVACVWFGANEAPFKDRLIVLNATGDGPALNVAVMSNISPHYAPDGMALIGAACPGETQSNLEDKVRTQLRQWWGSQVDSWRTLRTHVINHGQPDQSPPLHPKQSIKIEDGLFVCGDHRDTASIQGALFSGRRCGEAVVASIS